MRTAHRNDPQFQTTNLKRMGNLLDDQRISRTIDNDVAVANNYQRMVGTAFQDVFENLDESMTLLEYREQTIREIRDSVLRLFPNLKFNSLANPLRDGTFRFTKGTSQGFSFMNLSGGEKAAFDLILDLIVARREFDDTVFCIDEPEAHLNSRLQGELLSVLYDLVPENCQLMLATHSIGIMRRARDIEKANPGSVVFLDFGEKDYDEPHVIEPTKPSRSFWKSAHEVALNELAALVAPERVVICEGYPLTNRLGPNHSLDARCYDIIFETEFPETRFISMGNDREVSGDKFGLAQALLSLVEGLNVVKLIDRDDRSDQEVDDARNNGVRVLSRRNLESYLFNDEVLEALTISVGMEDKFEELRNKNQSILNSRSDVPPDNLKPASGEIYIACKRILKLTQVGNNTSAFMRDTLAPLIRPGMNIYEELKRDILETNESST